MNHIEYHLTTGYAKAAKILWDMALKSGDYPIIGVCLGFNLMATLSNNNGVDKVTSFQNALHNFWLTITELLLRDSIQRQNVDIRILFNKM